MNRRATSFVLAAIAVIVAASTAAAQQTPKQSPKETATQTAKQASKPYTHADTVRGMNGPGRAWWDAQFYDLHVRVNPADSSIRGYNTITYRVIKPSGIMQIDLQQPME